MIDIELIQDEQGYFDIDIESGDLKSEDGFDTAIYISLLTDARAPESKVAQPEHRRGWVGNSVSPVEGREIGGLLWLAEQRRLTIDTLNEVIDYAQKSLNWFVEDGLAKKVETTGEIIPRTGIELTVTITSFAGIVTNHYVQLWEVTGNAD